MLITLGCESEDQCNEVFPVIRKCNSLVTGLQGVLGDGWLRFHVDARQPYGVHIPGALERVQLIVHHPAVLESEAILPIDRGARPRRQETLGRLQERTKLLHLGIVVRLFDGGQLSIGGTAKALVGVHLHAVVAVLQAVGIAGIREQVAVHHRLIYGDVDVGVVV